MQKSKPTLKMSDEELDGIMKELQKFMMLAQDAAGIEDRKQHIIDIYKIYNRIETELSTKNYWLEHMEMLDEEHSKTMERLCKITMCDTVVIKDQKFLLVPVSTPSMPCAGAPFEQEDSDMDKYRSTINGHTAQL